MVSRAVIRPKTHWPEVAEQWLPPELERLSAEIGDAFRLPFASQGDRIRGALGRAVSAPGLISPVHTCPDQDCYARHILYADPGGRFTILALAWGPGQASPVHAHTTWCAYAVRSGALTETLFAFDTDGESALAKTTHERRAGYACYAPAGLERGHRLANSGSETAVSIHVYGVGADRIATGVNRVFDFA